MPAVRCWKATATSCRTTPFFNRQLVLTANDDVEQALLTLINSFSKYSVIIVKRDRYAAEAMRLLREFTIAVPQEVSLLSLEDSRSPRCSTRR